jgi:hypothetical protein
MFIYKHEFKNKNLFYLKPIWSNCRILNLNILKRITLGEWDAMKLIIRCSKLFFVELAPGCEGRCLLTSVRHFDFFESILSKRQLSFFFLNGINHADDGLRKKIFRTIPHWWRKLKNILDWSKSFTCWLKHHYTI